MNKPTVFFSHSSKDKDLVLLIKNKVENITKKTINIFMSSDGQSIPFGTNWIHKIEDGLNESKIMFVFVTNNSIDSGWIYFESGFAYSKNIKVIPIGIGVDIGKISAPLSLLQGFNVTSSDSLNNFITIINSNFDYDFDEGFTNDDFQDINQLILFNAPFNFKLDSRDFIESTEAKWRSIDEYFNYLPQFFDEQNIPYFISNVIQPGNVRYIVSNGVKISYQKNNSYNSIIDFTISALNFENSFNFFKK